MSLRLASFFVAFMVPAESQTEPLAIYGDYLIVSSFVDPFWAERSRMGYAYHQRNFNNMAEMLQWSASNHIDWGWKEGSDYGQLFYRQTDTGYNPAFPQSVTAWTLYGSFNPYGSDACGFGKRCFFVKTSALVYHPSWANTWARAAYLERTQQASVEKVAKGEQTNVSFPSAGGYVGELTDAGNSTDEVSGTKMPEMVQPAVAAVADQMPSSSDAIVV